MSNRASAIEILLAQRGWGMQVQGRGLDQQAAEKRRRVVSPRESDRGVRSRARVLQKVLETRSRRGGCAYCVLSIGEVSGWGGGSSLRVGPEPRGRGSR